MPTAKVLDVIDGKSLLISPKWKIGEVSGCILRLEGVAAPDRTEPGGAEAKESNNKICTGKNISYTGEKIDPFQRLISRVEINGVSVNETLFDLGYRE